MVLDPLSAVSLAGTIITFLEFCEKLGSGAHEIYRSTEGITKDLERYKALATTLVEFSSKLRDGLQPNTDLTRSERDLDALAKTCEKEANDLALIIGKLNLSEDRKNVLRSLQKSFQGLRKQEALKGFEQRLHERRQNLNNMLLAITNDKNTSMIKGLRDLSKQSEVMGIDQTKRFDQIRAMLTSIRKDDFSSLHVIITNLLDKIPEVGKEQSIFSSLQFPQIRVRRAAIDKNHAETFRWIFQKNPDQQHRDQVKFVEWLESSATNDRIFWVGGKAGSGKSTLMKFVCDHSQTVESLRRWAGSHKLVIASYFFWYAGNDLQKSQEGLLRTLLLEVLRCCPDLITALFPARWNDSNQESGTEWNTKDLTDAFSLLKSSLTSSVRFCFFIDGLDEYIGDPQSIIDAIQHMCASDNIKICTSSRPWPVFQQAFEGNRNRRLHMQDLTRDDIEKYVTRSFGANPVFVKAKEEDPKYQTLIDVIIEKANGVFLWVTLVVCMLCNIITDANTVSELLEKLEQLPSDLNEFFQHMLDSIDESYKSQSAWYFQAAVESSSSLLLLQYSTLDDIMRDPEYVYTLKRVSAGSATMKPSVFEDSTGREMKMEKRLNARTKGLLEVVKDRANAQDRGFIRRVDFLHRTVAEFLRKDHIKQQLIRYAGGELIHRLAISQSFLAVLKLIPLDPYDHFEDSLLLELLHKYCFYAREAGKDLRKAAVKLTDELQRVVNLRDSGQDTASGMVDLSGKHNRSIAKTHKRLIPSPHRHALLELMTQHGIAFYLEAKSDEDAALLKAIFNRPLLFNALCPKITTYSVADPRAVVHLLLNHGYNPNEIMKDQLTVWTTFLNNFLHDEQLGDRRATNGQDAVLHEQRRELLEPLLARGARSNVSYQDSVLFGQILNDLDELHATRAEQRSQLLNLFLRFGADPNGRYKGSTVWRKRLSDLYERRSNEEYFHLEASICREIEILLLHDANPSAVVKRDGTHTRKVKAREIKYPNTQKVGELIEACFPSRADHLLEIISESQARQRPKDTWFKKFLNMIRI